MVCNSCYKQITLSGNKAVDDFLRYTQANYNIILEKSINSNYINEYYGITQNSDNQNFMIVMKYYESGDLTHCIANDFFNLSWHKKLNTLRNMAIGLKNIHGADIIHKDYHSGNIFIKGYQAII